MIRFLLILLVLISAAEVRAQSVLGAPQDRTRVIEQPPEERNERSPVLERAQQQKQELLENNIHMREILILINRGDQREIADSLKEQGYETLQTHNLRSLDSVLIVTKGNYAALSVLRNRFPEAEIDWNDDLSASEGSRLFAKDKINWPDGGACLDEALKIPIGVIDGMIDRTHPAFAGQTIIEKNFLEGKIPDSDHATAISSILIGNAPDQGFDGLLTGAKLYSAMALRRSPDDKQLASIAAIIRSLDWLMGKEVRLINVSLAGKKNHVLATAFEKSHERGTLIFAAAGNDGPHAPPAYPAAIDDVFAITAVDVAGHVYKQANQGDYIDYAAPGVDIWTAVPGGGAYKSGTSYAVPYAIAIAALYLAKNPDLSRDVLVRLMGDKQNIFAKCN